MTAEELRQILNTISTPQNAAQWGKSREVLRQKGLDTSNFYQEMEMSSPYVNTHSDITYAYEAMALHSHSFYEIICCRSNCGAEYLVGSHRYVLQKGDVIRCQPLCHSSGSPADPL